MSILSGNAIADAVGKGKIRIDPFVERHLNPASVDLTLGDVAMIYTTDIFGERKLDAKVEPKTNIWRFEALDLEPGKLYLLHTAERIWTRSYVPVLDGKSSIGRLGVCVHLTAGYGDPGFDGQYTLEVTAVYPTRIYAGMRFCQMRFHELAGSFVDYASKGNYQGEHASGPVPSRVWKQFEESK